MIYAGLVIIYFICFFKAIKEYRQMEYYLKYKKPTYNVECEELNTLYVGSVNGIINTHPYQEGG